MASLKVRFLLVTSLILALFALSAGFILRQSFDVALRDRAQEQLKLHVYSLLAVAEFKNGKLELPPALTEPRFNQLQSGLFAAVFHSDQPVWRSQSYLGAAPGGAPYSVPGDWLFDEFRDNEQHYFRVTFTVVWEHRKKETPFTFVVWESDQPYQAQIRGFESTLWEWLGGLIVVSIAGVFGLLYLGFRPFAQLAGEVSAIESGERQSIVESYPTEVMPVVSNFNRLLEHEQKQRERYKHSLGDLAHSLKTPLAVIRGLDLSDPEKSLSLLTSQVQQMDDIIGYQLRRARAVTPALTTRGIPLQPIISKLITALQKVYADKTVRFEVVIDPQCLIPCEEGDAFEMLGNLLDNACKHGGDQIQVSARKQDGSFFLTVEDNGSGVPEVERALILQRGVRRDERAPGQGIGMAVVAEIVTTYGGTLGVQQSAFGGACFEILLPL